MTRFSEALEYLEPYVDKQSCEFEVREIHECDDLTDEEKDSFIGEELKKQAVNKASYLALKVLDKMERKEVSDGMKSVGLNGIIEEPLRLEIYEEDIEGIFNRTSAQLIKETEDE